MGSPIIPKGFGPEMTMGTSPLAPFLSKERGISEDETKEI